MSSFTDMLVDNQDQALIDNTLPALLLGGRIGKTGINWFNNAKPYLKDAWSGKDILFQGLLGNKSNDFWKKGKSFYKNTLHPKTTNNSLVNEGQEIFFPNSSAGKIDREYIVQLPFARYNINKAKSNQRMPVNKAREDSDYFDNLKVNWLGKDYAYQIKNNIYNKQKEFHNIKPYELLEKEIENLKQKGGFIYELLQK